jgi:hypothetical protein
MTRTGSGVVIASSQCPLLEYSVIDRTRRAYEIETFAGFRRLLCNKQTKRARRVTALVAAGPPPQQVIDLFISHLPALAAMKDLGLRPGPALIFEHLLGG